MGELTHGNALTTKEGERVRLWGTLEEQEKAFGRDLEKLAWRMGMDMACKLEGRFNYWEKKGWNDTCTRCKEHYRLVFADGDEEEVVD